MAGKKKLVPGFLYNDKEGFKYPKGKLFLDEKEYLKAVSEGWLEKPYKKGIEPPKESVEKRGPGRPPTGKNN